MNIDTANAQLTNDDFSRNQLEVLCQTLWIEFFFFKSSFISHRLTQLQQTEFKREALAFTHKSLQDARLQNLADKKATLNEYTLLLLIASMISVFTLIILRNSRY